MKNKKPEGGMREMNLRLLVIGLSIISIRLMVLGKTDMHMVVLKSSDTSMPVRRTRK